MSPSRSRRAVIGTALGLVVGSAGCLQSRDRSTADATPTDAPVTESETTDRASPASQSPAIEELRVRNHYLYLLSGTHPRVTRRAGYQYVTVGVSGAGTNLDSLAALSLSLDGESYPRSERRAHLSWEYPAAAFAVPLDVEADAGRVTWGDRTLAEPDAAAIARLNDPPVFEVSDVSVPDTVRGTGKETDIELSFTVANVGDGEGTFAADTVTTSVSGWGRVRVSVPPGESVSVTKTLTHRGRATTEETVSLRWGSGEFSRTVDIDRNPYTESTGPKG